MTADDFVSRLTKSRRSGPGRWVACCPAHEDHNPSMTIRELQDGRILLHCFAGCSVGDIVGAVGVEVSDLFPDKQIEHAPRLRKPFPADDVIAAMELEVQIIMLCAGDVAEGRPLSDDDRERVRIARRRLDDALAVARGER